MKQKVTKVLLSIKPEFANQIFNGSKLYEFRRTIFKNRDIKVIIVYASSPIQKIVGEFEIDEIIKDDISSLWNITQKNAGISEAFFLKYFDNKERGYAIKIKNPKLYSNPFSLNKLTDISPPQSFAYIK